MSIIPQQYLDAVVSIGVKSSESAEPNWIGTGFFVAKKIDENCYQPFLVSNKHIFQGKSEIIIRLQQRESEMLPLCRISILKDGKPNYSEHPSADVDIAAILINGSIITDNKLNLAFFDIDNHVLTSEEYLKQGGNAGSGIFMIGFPMGLVDINSTTPICRTGCIARIDKAEINNTKNILLDLQNYPGNSGSPIVSKCECISVDKTKALSTCSLIGIVHGYIPYEEKLINTQTKRVVEIRSENSGIAVAHPAEFIKEVVEIEFNRT